MSLFNKLILNHVDSTVHITFSKPSTFETLGYGLVWNRLIVTRRTGESSAREGAQFVALPYVDDAKGLKARRSASPALETDRRRKVDSLAEDWIKLAGVDFCSQRHLESAV
jgi:hypothetical protein